VVDCPHIFDLDVVVSKGIADDARKRFRVRFRRRGLQGAVDDQGLHRPSRIPTPAARNRRWSRVEVAVRGGDDLRRHVELHHLECRVGEV
jgi:hypothetical protein